MPNYRKHAARAARLNNLTYEECLQINVIYQRAVLSRRSLSKAMNEIRSDYVIPGYGVVAIVTGLPGMPHEDRFEEMQACAIEIVQKELADAAIQRKLNTPPEHVKYWYIVNERGEFWTTGYGWGGKIGADRFADPKDINGLPVDGRGSLVWCR